jgi:hypothetical protein
MKFAHLCITTFFFVQVTLGSVWSLGVIYAVVTDQIIGREPDLPCQVPLNLFTRICHAGTSRSLYLDLPWQVPLDLFNRICYTGTSRSLYPDLPCQVPLDLFTRICHARYLSISLPGSAMAGTSRSLYPDLPWQVPLDLFTRICNAR